MVSLILQLYRNSLYCCSDCSCYKDYKIPFLKPSSPKIVIPVSV